MLQKKNVTKLLSTITLSSALLVSATVVAGNEQANVVEASTSSVKLTHNAYVYNYQGKRIKGARTLKKGRSVKVYRTKTIHGKKYLYIGSHRYINLANTKKTSANKALFKVEVVYPSPAYKLPNKHITKTFVDGTVNVYAEKKDSRGKTWYKVGTNKWINSELTHKITEKSHQETETTTNQNVNTTQSTQTNSSSSIQHNETTNTKFNNEYTNIKDSDFATKLEQEFIAQLNELRQSKGLNPLALDTSLQEYARTRATEAITSFSHTRPDGSHTQYAEVLAGGAVDNTDTPSVQAKIRLDNFIYHDAGSNWGHRDILLSSQYTKIGVGIAWDPNSSNGFLGYSLIANLKQYRF